VPATRANLPGVAHNTPTRRTDTGAVVGGTTIFPTSRETFRLPSHSVVIGSAADIRDRRSDRGMSESPRIDVTGNDDDDELCCANDRGPATGAGNGPMTAAACKTMMMATAAAAAAMTAGNGGGGGGGEEGEGRIIIQK